MESIPAIFPDQDPKHALIKQDATVMVNPSVGGGTARYMNSTPDGAMVDIKGIARELAADEFSLPERDYEDGYQKGNDWFHMSAEPDTIGTMNDRPEFRAGDMVKIADVYGSVIGPGMGIFIAYSTSGKECIISFDDKEILVPTANVGAVLEQNAKNKFGEMDNDGNLSPMSLGSDNVKIEEPAMDQRDEFSKWMATVEEALSGANKNELEESMPVVNECGCGSWNCPTCFPEQGMDQMGSGCPECSGEGCPSCDGSEMAPDAGLEVDGLELIDDEYVDEETEDFVEKPKSGKGVKLGDIVTKTEVRPTGGQNSPMTYGDDNLGAVEEAEPMMPDTSTDAYGKAGRYSQEHFGQFDEANPEMDDAGSEEDYQTLMSKSLGSDQDIEHSQELVSQIMNMQTMGLSKDDNHYSEEELLGINMGPEDIKRIHDKVMGTVSEETPGKPTKQKTKHHLDDLDDILNPREPDLPATIGGSDDDMDGDVSADEPMRLPSASRDTTQQRVAGIAPSDEMRGWMSRINPAAGGDEADIPDAPPEANMVVRNASDVPAVISSAMQASGMQTPEWHNVNNLPGYGQRNVRGMGRQVFGMFTNTPLENIQTIANVQGQGPNTDAEMRAVAGWLRNNAEDLGDIDVSHGMAIPGYQPDVKEYRINGVRFHVVRDPMGQYIYAYPDADARLGGPAGGQQGQLPGRDMPRLRESLKPTLFEQMKWDEEIDEAFIAESSLSKLIGKQKGGQNLVKWLHKKHRLSNDADLQPAPFSERLLWKEFKANPDNFVIVNATDGVAGIKPDKKFIDARTKEFARKGKQYNPGGDSTLPYQVIAFTDDGQQIDPELLRAPPEDGEDYRDPRDPTVMRARMGKHSGRDMQNPYNVFNLLAEQIGALRTVYISGFENEKGGMQKGSVERDKMNKRADMKKSDIIPPDQAVQKIFMRIKPVLKTLANQAILQINKRAQRYLEGGNFEAGQKVMATGQKLKQLLVSMDTNNAVNIDTTYVSKTKELSSAITKAIAQASGSPVGSEGYNEYASEAAAGNIMQLRPILDGVRDQLVGL